MMSAMGSVIAGSDDFIGVGRVLGLVSVNLSTRLGLIYLFDAQERGYAIFHVDNCAILHENVVCGTHLCIDLLSLRRCGVKAGESRRSRCDAEEKGIAASRDTT